MHLFGFEKPSEVILLYNDALIWVNLAFSFEFRGNLATARRQSEVGLKIRKEQFAKEERKKVKLEMSREETTAKR